MTEDRPIALIVEDRVELAYLAGEMFEEIGFDAKILHCPDAVIALLDPTELVPDWAHRISFVFLDMMLAHAVTGLDLARKIRAHRPGIVIFLTTGYIGSPDAQDAAAEGFRLIPKPYRLRDLVEVSVGALPDVVTARRMIVPAAHAPMVA